MYPVLLLNAWDAKLNVQNAIHVLYYKAKICVANVDDIEMVAMIRAVVFAFYEYMFCSKYSIISIFTPFYRKKIKIVT